MLLSIFCLYLLIDSAYAQSLGGLPVDRATGRIRYQAVVPVAGVSQADLVARACEWATAAASPDTPPVIWHQPDTEVLVLSGAQPFAYTYAMGGTFNGRPRTQTIRSVLHYTLRLYLEEGRYRYEATDFAFVRPTSPTKEPAEDPLIRTKAITESGASSLAAERQQFQVVTAKLLTQLQDAMRKPSGESAAN